MAVYSNRYFLSRDTVDDNNYRYPEIKRDDGYFGYGLDENGEEFPLVEVREKEISKFVFGDSYVITPVSYDVLDSYFERLGPKAVLYGVGVVELFFNSEDEWKIIKEINPYNDSELSLVDRISYDFSFAGEIQKITNRTKNLLGSIGGLISDTFTSENDLELTQVIDLTEENSNSEEIVNNLVSESASEIQAQTEVISNCSFSSNSNLKKGDILINEVAWMGTQNSPSDEWMELKNISDQSINVDGYKVIGERNQINIVLPNISLESGEFLLLERKEGSVPHIDSDLIYTGVLRNSDEGIRVFDPGCNLIDEVFADPDWLAGDNSSKKTMERQANLSWQTSFFEGGTPKEDSSKGDVNINPEVFVDKTSLVRGEVLDEGGSGFSPNSSVELHFILPNGRDVIDYVTTGDNGDFLKVYTMPYDALLGDYSYYAIDLESGESSSSVNYKVT
ncbi:MAG: lamin tail domain-containing protein, partial [Candidatus Paceibacterota bacterium]